MNASREKTHESKEHSSSETLGKLDSRVGYPSVLAKRTLHHYRSL